MGLKFSNRTAYPNISYNNKMITNSTTHESYLLFRFSTSNFNTSNIIKRTKLQFQMTGSTCNYALFLYKINHDIIDDISETNIDYYLSNVYSRIDDKKDTSPKDAVMYLDELFQEAFTSSSFSFCLAIKCINDSGSSLGFSVDFNSEFLLGELYNSSKESYNHESLSNDFGFLGSSRVDLYKNKLYFNVLNINTTNNVPLSLSATYAYGHNGIFGKNITCEYEYKVKITSSYIEVINSIGDSSFYVLTDRNYAKEKYDIDPVGYSGNLFVNLTDFTYIVKNSSTNSFILFNRDSSRVSYSFNGTLNQDTNIYINSIVTLKGTINYSWTNNKISSISINDTLISLTYNNGYVSRIDYDKSRYCLFEYYTLNSNKYLKKIKYCDNRNPLQTEIVHKTACFEYQSSSPYKLTYVYDDLTKLGVKYDYNNSNELLSISSVLKNTSDYSNKVTIYKNNSITKIVNHLGKECYYYFDNYGKCYQIIDDLGNISSKEYQRDNLISSDALKTCESSGIINSYNLLENSCFVGDPIDQEFIWECNNIFRTGINHSRGLDGRPSLRVYNILDTTFVMEQELRYLTNLANKKLSFNGYVRGSGTISLSIIINGITTSMNFTASSVWERISLSNISIPNTLSSLTVKITILREADVRLCDFSLNESDRTRTNYLVNGNLDSNYYSSNPFSHWTKTNFSTDDVVESVSLFAPLNMLIDRRVLINGNLNTVKELKQVANVSGNAGEELLLSFFAKMNNTNNDICYSYIKINYLLDGEKTYPKVFGDNSNNYKLINQSLITESSYKQITIGFVFRCKNSVELASFGLYKETYGTYYNFSEKNSLEEIAKGKLSNETEFDGKSFVKRFTSNSGETFEYNYLNNGDVERIADMNGNEFSFNYDNNGYLNKNTIKTINNKRLILEQTNDSNGNPIYVKTYDEKITASEYDDRERLVKRNTSSGLVEHFSYNQKDLLVNKQYDLESNNIINHDFSYNNKEQISEVSITSGSEYEFSLYDEWGSLKNLILDNNTLNSFTYYKHDNIYTGLLSSKAYPNGTYNFYYDEKHRLIRVAFAGNNVVEYFYDSNDLLIKKIDLSGTTYYEYDLNGRLIVKKTTNNSSSIRYSNEYDNLNNIQSKTIDINGDKLNYNYAYLYENNEYTQGSYFSRLEKISDNDYVFENSKLKYGDNPELDNVNSVRDKDINRDIMRFVSSNDSLVYSVAGINCERKTRGKDSFDYDEWSSQFTNHKQVFLWVRVNSLDLNGNVRLLALGDDSTEYAYLECRGNGRIRVGYDGSYYEYYRINPGEWNLIGIDFETVTEDNETITNITTFVNRYKHTDTKTGSIVSDISRIMLGCFHPVNTERDNLRYDDDLTMPFDVLYLSIGNNTQSLDGYKGIYNDGYKYVFSIPQKKTKGVCYYNHSVYDDLDVIPLNGNFTSIKGLKPTSFNYGDSTYSLDKTKLFKYDGKISNIDNEYTNRHIYGSYNNDIGLTGITKSILSYDLGLGNTGTISFRFKMDSTDEFNRYYARTLLCAPSNDNSGHKLLVEISNWNQTIALYYPGISGTRIYTDLTVTADEWHLFTITWNSSIVRLYLDNQSTDPYLTANQINLTNLITYIGCNYLGNQPNHHLNGVIEMLTYSNSYMTTIHNTLLNGGTPISHITSFDELERPCLKETLTGKTRLNHKYDYYDELVTENNNEYYKASSHPCIETLEDGTKIVYSYDAIGNITSKVSSKNGILGENISYEYDVSGRLKKEICYQGSVFNYHYEYNYNNNGDISTKISYYSSGTIDEEHEYVYSNTIKGQLNQINIYDRHYDLLDTIYFNYSSADPFRPSSYKGNSLSWQGRRLTSFGTNSYSYNSEGIRISKTTSSGTFLYFLDYKKIIKETKPTYGNVFYHYDEEGMLVGFHYDNNEYFYVRDLTGNIVKVLDSNGNIKVEYKYNAWGKLLSITGDNTIKNVNSYLYKGYYYDFETELYYCNSRYYDPDVCRWISIDESSFLDYQSVNETNLWCYCGNNPISGVDINGYFSWKKFGICAAIAAIAVVAIAATVVTCGAAAAGAGMVVGATLTSVCSATTACTVASIATVGTYVAAGAITAGIAAYAVADIQEVVTDGEKNYLSFLGDSYEPIKGALYFGAFAMPYLAQFSPNQYTYNFDNIESSDVDTNNGTKKSIGVYLIKKGNQVIYVGKGSEQRMNVSLIERGGDNSIFYPCSSEEMAFANEAYYINLYGGPQSMGGSLSNKINSPGLKYLNWWF